MVWWQSPSWNRSSSYIRQLGESQSFFPKSFGPWLFSNKNIVISHSFSQSVQLLSCVQLFATSWTAARQASLCITSSWSLLKLMSIESVMPANYSSCVVPFSSCPQSFPASGSFQMAHSLHQVAKVLEFQLQHQSFQWTPRTDLL